MIKLSAKSQIMNHDETLTVSRDGAVTYIEGLPVKAAGTTFSIRANVQALDSKELLMVPELDRYRENYWVFTEEEIRVNDIVTRNSVKFQVQQLEEWGSYRGAVRMVRIDVGPNTN